MRDIREGLSCYWLWIRLAIQDIQLRYRGSLLGPLWLTASTAVMASAMGILYGKLFGIDVSTYLPFVTTGLVCWLFISSTVNEASETFVSAGDVIQQTKLPYSLYVFRMVARNLIVFAHNVIILPFFYLVYPPTLSVHMLEIIPSIAILSLNGVSVSFIIGMLGARFRDLPPIINNIVQLMFFVTPIFWSPDLLKQWEYIAKLNPLFAAIDILRSPLLGQPPSSLSWPIISVVTIIGLTLSMTLFVRFRSRIVYWV